MEGAKGITLERDWGDSVITPGILTSLRWMAIQPFFIFLEHRLEIKLM